MTNSRLEDFIPPDAFLGTSLILRQGERFLYGIRPPKSEGQRTILELTGIGGKLEAEDASFTAGVLREAGEEIGCDSYGLSADASCSIRLLECKQTLLVRGAADLAWVEISGVEKPAALVFRQHRSPPHQPWQGQEQSLSCLVVFKAELVGEAHPHQELPWLAWLDSAQAARAAREDVLLDDLLQGGATIIDGSPGQLTPAGKLTPAGSRPRRAG